MTSIQGGGSQNSNEIGPMGFPMMPEGNEVDGKFVEEVFSPTSTPTRTERSTDSSSESASVKGSARTEKASARAKSMGKIKGAGIGASTLIGAGVGAAFGALFGPAAPATIPIAAAIGAVVGLLVGLIAVPELMAVPENPTIDPNEQRTNNDVSRPANRGGGGGYVADAALNTGANMGLLAALL
ncbi:hypothetical protein N9Y92_03875 [Chlamydiales bacterium]|nr:hypothetical protein [Chlamydiales bacterium]